MQTKHITFEEIYDILAVRIIFCPKNPEEELNECFNIYVSISKIYKPHPDRLRDWVSHPKANGYQATSRNSDEQQRPMDRSADTQRADE